MRKIFILAKILLKGGTGAGGKSGKRRWWLPVVLAFAFISFGFSMAFMALGLYDALDIIGAADAVIPLAIGATSVVIFMFGIFYTVSVMYHADDVSLLLALPLKPYQILGAKFLTLLVYEYIFEAFILLPVLIVYGIRAGAGALFAVYSVLLLLIIPVIALVMSAVLVMLVMRFTRFGKNKQMLNYIGGIIALVMAIGLNIAMQSFAVTLSEGQIAADAGQLSATLSRLFPGIGFAANALTANGTMGGLINLLLFALCSAFAAAVFLGFGQLVYFKGLVGVTEASAKRKLISYDELGKKTAGVSVTRAYVKKEIRLLVRSPIAFLNCVLMNFIWPVLILVMLFGSGQSFEMIRALVLSLNGSVLIAAFAGISAFVSSANAITSTAISREGKALYFVKYLPVEIIKQLNAKVLSGMLLSSIAVALMAAALIFFGAEPVLVIVALALGAGASFVSSVIGLFIDAVNPKLSWMNEQQAIKQNVNVMLHMLAGLALAAIIIVPVLLLDFSFEITLLYATALIGVLAVACGYGMIKSSAARIYNMDV
ncbi:MAG: hypothetical protein WDA65_07220 [Christensenellales bacterium]